MGREILRSRRGLLGAGALFLGGAALLGGGLAASRGSTADVPAGEAGGEWQTGPSLAVARSEVAAATANGVVYVLGGLAADGATLGVVEALEPGAVEWAMRRPLPEPRDHLAAVELGGDLWVVGGSPGWFNQQTSTTLWRYDARQDTWEHRAPMPLGRAAHASAVIDGVLYVVGGIGPDPQKLLAYDPIADLWTERAPLPRPREHLAAAAVDGQLFVI
ncbi:MAG TPA: kelch repeat-containing protein, partial [Chloroflexota bacterium]|nr:kelch repeat-containing protein [Chloroflexota bacterium]